MFLDLEVKGVYYRKKIQVQRELLSCVKNYKVAQETKLIQPDSVHQLAMVHGSKSGLPGLVSLINMWIWL